VTTDLNTLLTALYVKIDDHLGRRTRLGRPPKLSDAELLTLAVAQRAQASGGAGLLGPPGAAVVSARVRRAVTGTRPRPVRP
jgi:hypothetical protein